jgi:hypothetical protein
VLAAYTVGDAILTVVIFLAWLAFLGVAIWLLIRLFRNTNFISGNRALRITVKVLLVVFAVFLPLLGVPVLFVIWYSTRSRGAKSPDAHEAELEAPPTSPAATPDVPSTTPRADVATYRRPLPFPPPSARKDTGG